MATTTGVDRRSVAAAAFVKGENPNWLGGIYPTAKELGHSFKDGYLMLWNNGAIYYGVRTDIIPDQLLETETLSTARILYLFNEYEELGYRTCGAFPIDALRSTIAAQKKAASIAHKRRTRGSEFWIPFLVNDRPNCVAGFDPDVLLMCYTLLGEKDVELQVPLENPAVLPILLKSPMGKVYVLPVRM